MERTESSLTETNVPFSTFSVIIHPETVFEECKAEVKTTAFPEKEVTSDDFSIIPDFGPLIKHNDKEFDANILKGFCDKDHLTYRRHLVCQKINYDENSSLLYAKFTTKCADSTMFMIAENMEELEGLTVGGDSGAPVFVTDTEGSLRICGVLSTGYMPNLAHVARAVASQKELPDHAKVALMTEIMGVPCHCL